MLGFAFDTIADRIRERVTARVDTVLARLDGGDRDSESRLAATVDILCEFLPLDARRRDEAFVWIEFETAARTDGRLAETSRRAAAGLARLVETILESAQRHGAIDSTVGLSIEAARLSALLDGLTLRSALHPGVLSPDTAREVITAHLRELGRLGVGGRPSC